MGQAEGIGLRRRLALMRVVVDEDGD